MNVVGSYYPSQYDTQYQTPQYQPSVDNTQYQTLMQMPYQQYPTTYNTTPIPQQQPVQQYYQQPNYFVPNSYFFEKNETLYPDYASYPEKTDLQAPYTAYNLSQNVQYTPYGTDYVYEQYMKQNYSPNRDQNTEEILRKNPHLWNLYQSGRFEIVQMFDSKEKKIILKEKSMLPDPKYKITKFKVPVNTAQGTDDGHVLLVSFSNSQFETNQQPAQVELSPQYAYDEVMNRPAEHVIKPVEPFSNTQYTSEEQRIVGPGSGLVARLIEGSDSGEESDIYDDEVQDEVENAAEDDAKSAKTDSKSKIN